MKWVLIVEDTDHSRELLRVVVEKLGHGVIEARDGNEALRQLQAVIPDLIFLDLKIPSPNGYDLLAEIRNSRFSSTPVIALTANAMTGERERALAAGFDGYLAKPVTLTQIRSAVERMLDLQQQNDQAHPDAGSRKRGSPRDMPGSCRL